MSRPRSRSRGQDWDLFDLQFRGHLTLPFDYENEDENKPEFESGADQLSPLPSANQGCDPAKLGQHSALNFFRSPAVELTICSCSELLFA
jgi:hypothetical protein